MDGLELYFAGSANATALSGREGSAPPPRFVLTADNKAGPRAVVGASAFRFIPGGVRFLPGGRDVGGVVDGGGAFATYDYQPPWPLVMSSTVPPPAPCRVGLAICHLQA